MKNSNIARFSSPAVAWLARFVFATVLSVSISASASADVNGKYKYRKAKGSFSVAGQTINIGKNDLKSIVTKKGGTVVIKKNKIRLAPDGAAEVIDESFSGPDYDITVSATGPKSITLTKKGKAYSGTAEDPIVVEVDGTAAGQPIDGTFEFEFNAKVKGKKLLFTVPVGGSISGFPVTGTIKILCKRR